MARKRLVLDHAIEASCGSPYSIRLARSIANQIKAAKAEHGGSWQDWAGAAVKRLQQETPIEIKSLADQATMVAGAREDIEQLPLRIGSKDMDTVRAMASEYDTNIQSILIAALHLYSFVSSMTSQGEEASL